MLQITKDASGGEVEVKLGDCFEVAFPENPTTGYRWHLRCSGGSVLELQEDSFQASSAATLGAGGTRRWRFCAAQAGAADVELEHRRSWEKQPAETARMTIRVKA